MGSLKLAKAWLPLDQAQVDALPGQLGVYQLGDADDEVIKIGMAGATERFGLRSALAAEVDRDLGPGTSFRYECTHGYMTRWQELLMLHVAEHGSLPAGNAGDERHVGRLSPGST